MELKDMDNDIPHLGARIESTSVNSKYVWYVAYDEDMND